MFALQICLYHTGHTVIYLRRGLRDSTQEKRTFRRRPFADWELRGGVRTGRNFIADAHCKFGMALMQSRSRLQPGTPLGR